MSQMMAAIGLHCEGRWQECRPLLERGVPLYHSQSPGDQFLEVAEIAWLHAILELGDFTALSRQASASLRAARGREDLYTATNILTLIMPYVHLAADRPEEARQEVRAAIDRWPRREWHLQHDYAMNSQCDVLLYEGDGDAAWRLLCAGWGALSRSLLLRMQVVRVYSYYLHGKCAVAAAVHSEHRAQLLRVAARDARRLRGERGVTGSAALGDLIDAGVSRLRGVPEQAIALLAQAAAALRSLGMVVHAACADRHRGALMGGEEGAALQDVSDQTLRARDVCNPQAMARMVAPGLAS